MTYLEFKQAVYSLIRDDDPSDEQAAQAGAEYVKGKIAREVDKDILLAKSYMDSYSTMRFNLLGYESTYDDAQYAAAVKEFLTVDSDRAGLELYLPRIISVARQDQEGMKATVENLIRQGMLDLMSHIDNYRISRRSCYELADSVTVGNASRLRMPADAAPQDILYIRNIDELVPGTYVEEDLVLSNGKVYKVVIGGTLTEEEIGDGLTASTDTWEVSYTCDCSNSVGVLAPQQVLGSVTFRYLGEEYAFRKQVQVYPWEDRTDLESTPVSKATKLPPSAAIDPTGYSVYVWPKLDADHRYEITWTGILHDFNDGDTVTFDEMACQAVANYVRGHLLKMIDDRAGATLAGQIYVSQRSLLFANSKEKSRFRYSRG